MQVWLLRVGARTHNGCELTQQVTNRKWRLGHAASLGSPLGRVPDLLQAGTTAYCADGKKSECVQAGVCAAVLRAECHARQHLLTRPG
jgi:hypothetical protein